MQVSASSAASYVQRAPAQAQSVPAPVDLTRLAVAQDTAKATAAAGAALGQVTGELTGVLVNISA